MLEVKSDKQVMKYQLSNDVLDKVIVVKYDIHDDILARVKGSCEIQGWKMEDCSLKLELPDFVD